MIKLFSIEIEDEEEQEMQIGYPTDIKHIAHIGWDGQSINNSPNWVGYSYFHSNLNLYILLSYLFII